MLKVFRDNLKYLSWVLWLVILVFILFVFVDFGGTVPGGTAPANAAVTVGRHKITYGEFQQAYDRYEAFYRDSMGDQFSRELARQIGLPVQVLNGLIADRVLVEEARRMGLAVTDEELRDEILRQFNGNFPGEKEYERLLRRSGLTVDSFEASLRRDLLASKVRSVLANNVYIPESDVERAYRERVERAKIRFVKLEAEALADEVTVAPETVAAFFEANREDYRIPEHRVVDYLTVDRQAIQEGLEIGDEEIGAYYQENPDQFTEEEQVRARHILVRVTDEAAKETARAKLEAAKSRIEGGEDFAAVASEVSDDPGSKTRGGDLGFFGRGDMVPPFENAAFGSQPGTLVGPVETDFGFHLIEVLEKKEGGLKAIDEVKEVIRQRLAAERAAAVSATKAQDLAARIAREKLEPAAWAQLAIEETGVSVAKTPAIGRDDYVEGIGSGTGFSSSAFELPVGEVSDPIPIGSGWAILAVAAIEEPRLPELDEVRPEVRAAALERAQSEAAVARLESAATELAGGTSFDDVAAGLELEPEESALFGRRDAVGTLGRNPTVAEAALALGDDEIGGPIALDDGAVLFEVVERERFDPVRFDEEKETERSTLRDQRFAELLDSLIAQRRDELGVSFDPQLVENFGLAGGDSAGG